MLEHTSTECLTKLSVCFVTLQLPVT